MLDTRYKEGATSASPPGTSSWSPSLSSAGLLTCLRMMLPMPGSGHQSLVTSLTRVVVRVKCKQSNLRGYTSAILISSSSIPSDSQLSQLHIHINYNFPSLTEVTYLRRWQASMSFSHSVYLSVQVTRPGGCCHYVTVCHLPPHTLPELPAVQSWTVLAVQKVLDNAFFRLVLQWIG